MHTARQLNEGMFAVTRHGERATRSDILPGWGPLDRLGVVVHEPFGGVGASHLIQLVITAFYDVRPQRRSGRVAGLDPLAIYPDIYLFHVGGPHGDHSGYDFWPPRKEVFLESDPRAVLEAINDRGITRLAVPDGEPVAVEHHHKEPAAARDRITSAFAYAASGRVDGADWEIFGTDKRTEANATMVLDPEHRYAAARRLAESPDASPATSRWSSRTEARRGEAAAGLELAQRRRSTLRDEQGQAAETYRSISVDDAIMMLV